MIQDTHSPPKTEEVTYSVWILPERENEPTTYTGVVDLLKLPSGVIKIAHSDGVTDTRKGEVVRLRQEEIKTNE
jgi:hypothetical protein